MTVKNIDVILLGNSPNSKILPSAKFFFFPFLNYYSCLFPCPRLLDEGRFVTFWLFMRLGDNIQKKIILPIFVHLPLFCFFCLLLLLDK